MITVVNTGTKMESSKEATVTQIWKDFNLTFLRERKKEVIFTFWQYHHFPETHGRATKDVLQATVSVSVTAIQNLDKNYNYKEHTTSTRSPQLAGLYLSDSTVIWYWARDTEVVWKWDALSVLHITRRRLKGLADAAAWRNIMAKLKGSFGCFFVCCFLVWLAKVVSGLYDPMTGDFHASKGASNQWQVVLFS